MIMSGSAAKNNPEHNSGSAAKDMFFPPPPKKQIAAVPLRTYAYNLYSGSATENIRIQPI